MTPRVFLALDYIGLGDRAALLDGGLPAWREEKRPLTTEVPTWTPGRLSSHPRPEILADAAWLRAHLDDPALVLVEGRSPGEYAGTDHSERLPRSGHIPGAASPRPGLAESDRRRRDDGHGLRPGGVVP